MESLEALQGPGLEWPSPAYLWGAILFGLIGLIACRQGRRQARPRTSWIGIVLLFYPYLISRTWLLYLVGAGLCALLLIGRD